jgi:glucose/arabinose dehydrogenase
MGSAVRRLVRSCLPAVLALAASIGAAAPGGGAEPRPQELFAAHAPAATTTLPPGFSTSLVFSGLTRPTVLQFASDGRVFVGEKGGRVRVFDSLSDPSPTNVKDLSTEVYAEIGSDRGLLGMALDPANSTESTFVYVLYTLDAPIGVAPPVYNDSCPDPLGTGCTVGARLSRFEVFANGSSGAEQVLIEGWCQQYPSHSIGTLAFGPDGTLYVGGGDGASYTNTDWGQFGNPCGDPVNEGGALRAQDERTQSDPTGLNGAILRVDPVTGAAAAGNPLVGGDPSDDRIIAYGMRNPFRFAPRPGTDRIFVGDVGWNAWEEIDRIGSASDGTVENFGWPCYEGGKPQLDYRSARLQLCRGLYNDRSATTKPVLAVNHGPGSCNGSNVFSGMAFYPGGNYPAQYDGALFFTDIVRQCLWTMLPKPNGDPDPATFTAFGTGIAAVDLKPGPNGDIFYADLDGGAIRRLSFA